LTLSILQNRQLCPRKILFLTNNRIIELKERFKTLDILNLEKLIESITKFIELKTEIYELKVKEQLVHIISSFATLTLILTFGIIMLFFFSLALGFYLNTLFDSNFIGFALIGAFYLLIGILLILFKDKLITNRLFQTLFSETLISGNDEHEEDA
jgi:hypothetical protein